MLVSGFNVLCALLTFLSILHLSLAIAISTLNTTTSFITPRSSLHARLAQWKERNMQFCTYSFNRNQCVMASHFVEATQEAELYVLNYNCLPIAWMPPGPTTHNGETIVAPSVLPNLITYHVSEWWPSFDYEGVHYGSPTCVGDILGGASGCWQTFHCEERKAVA